MSIISRTETEISGVKFLCLILDNYPVRDLKNLVDALKKEIGSGVVMVMSWNDRKRAA